MKNDSTQVLAPEDEQAANAGSPGSVSSEQASVSPPVAVREDPYVGKTIDGRYLVERVLGEGGMGIVYKGQHRVIGKRVAIKVLRGNFATDKEITERFLLEAKSASSIGNAHIIDISDFGTLPDGSTYFVMEYLEGQSLAELMKENRPLPVPRLLHIATQIAQALEAAHLAGIIHRDLKPDNIMLINRGTDKDFVKILDFGIAKVGSGDASRLTRAGSVFGTPHYMSPEQAAGAAVDLRTDIYALGVILYEMASGKVPFDADNFMGILTQHMYKAPVPIRALVPAQEIPPGLDAVVLKCLSKKPDGRYVDMGALVKDLELVEKGGMPSAVDDMMARSGGFNIPTDYFRGSAMPAPVPATPSGFGKRTPWPLYAGIAGVVTAIGIVAGIFAKSNTTTAHPQAQAIGQGATPANVVSAPPASADSPQRPVDPVKKQVLLGVDPPDSKVTRDGRDLGEGPIALELKSGETVTLLVSRAGYRSQTVAVDGSEPKRLVRLAPVVAASRLSAKPTNAAQASATVSTPPLHQGFGSELSDPWGKH